ncbi:VWA domain-containing protein [bacterium AH-315-J19]|nr:VWA domain-containing protein [Robiginitomaculum sp.]MBN4058481.1 VWA domain-containing protein [bacterium AH-315-J19]
MKNWNSKTRISLGGIFLVLCLLLLKFCSPQFSQGSDNLTDLLIEYRAELEAPGLTVGEAAQNLKTAKAAYEFVRGHTGYSAYYGRRQTSENMLRTRVGNSPDRAVLLAAILQEMGWETKLYKIEDSKAVPQSGNFKRKQSKVLKKIAKHIGYDLKQQDVHVDQLQQTVDQEAKRMSAMVDKAITILDDKLSYSYSWWADKNPNFRHVYVVATKEGGKERYFNPTYPDQVRPETDTVFWNEYPAKPTDIELWMRDSRGIEQPLLHWEGQTAGHDISFGFLPTHDPIKFLDGSPDPTRVNVWTPVLQVEAQSITGRPFSTEGWTPGLGLEQPSANILDIVPMDPQAVTGIKIASIDTTYYPNVDVQVSFEGQGTGVVLPQHLKITDNGKTVRYRIDKLIPSSGAISIVSDVSGSMIDINAFELSKQAIIKLSKTLPPQTPVGLISFASDAIIEVELGPLGDGSNIKQAVNGLAERSFTGIHAALKKAAEDISLANGTIVLLTDGKDNVGGSLEKTLKILNAKNIRVIGIALGANADHKLIHQIADGTNGIAFTITDVGNLDDVYSLIGRQLSSYATLSYTARGSCFDELECEAYVDLIPSGIVAENTDQESVATETVIDAINTPENFEDIAEIPNARNISIKLRGTVLSVERVYEEPKLVKPTRPKLFFVFKTGSYSGWSDWREPYWIERVSKRDLFYLDDPNVGRHLIGRMDIMFDHGGFAPNIATASYISNWIQVLRAQDNNNTTEHTDIYDRPSYDLVANINGFRTLTNLGSGGKALLSGGPNIYLKRSLYLPGPTSQVKTQIFDVVDRWTRGYGVEKTDDILRLEVAGSIAESHVLGGQNAVETVLAANLDDLVVEIWKNDPPVKMPGDKPDSIKTIQVSGNHDWVWVADGASLKAFKGVYIGKGIMAKGGHIEELAKEFDKIDKMYEVYTNLAGYAGLNPVAGSLLGQIASFKREENKLWCYSTLMLGYVSEAIDDEDAVLNQSPESAKANSAKLCKMEFSPEGFGKHVMENAAKNAAEEAKSWAKGQGKSAVKNASTALGAGAAVNAYDTYNTANGYYNNVVNPTFHMAMASASGNGN